MSEQGKESEKVFCGECDYLNSNPFFSINGGKPYGCLHPDNLKDTWYARHEEQIEAPYERNKDNNCLLFKAKKKEAKEEVRG